jgi:DNA-binding GntR family transcriptional regulator
MKITNRTEQRIYDLIIEDIYSTDSRRSLLTNVQIGKVLEVSPITVRDKVIKLRKQGHLETLINYFDENNKFFQRIILQGTTENKDK